MNNEICKVISNEELIPGIFLMRLKSTEIASQSRAGQFVMIDCGEDTTLRRPISVHNIDGNKLALLYMVVGKGTEWLTHLKKDAVVDILGPMGNGFK